MDDFAFAGVSGCMGSVLFLIAFGAMFVGISFTLASMSGWSSMATAYPGSEEPEGEGFSWRSATIGWINYNSCLNFRVNPSGLHMNVSLLFQIGHKPIFIPWSELEIQAHKGLFFHYLDLSAAKTPAVRLRMMRWQAESILLAGGQVVPEKH